MPLLDSGSMPRLLHLTTQETLTRTNLLRDGRTLQLLMLELSGQSGAFTPGIGLHSTQQ